MEEGQPILPPLCAYLSLKPVGEALYRLNLLDSVTVSDAQLLVAEQLAVPDLVRVKDDSGNTHLFEFITLTDKGWIAEGSWTLGLNLKNGRGERFGMYVVERTSY